MNNLTRNKSKFNVRHLVSWYFGTFCALKYGYGRECNDKLHELATELEKKELKR